MSSSCSDVVLSQAHFLHPSRAMEPAWGVVIPSTQSHGLRNILINSDQQHSQTRLRLRIKQLPRISTRKRASCPAEKAGTLAPSKNGRQKPLRNRHADPHTVCYGEGAPRERGDGGADTAAQLHADCHKGHFHRRQKGRPSPHVSPTLHYREEEEAESYLHSKAGG